MKRFNKEKAREGASVRTRDGRKARIICFDRESEDYPIVALVTGEDLKEEVLVFYHKNGMFITGEENALDLFMAPTKHTKWVNIYKDTTRGCSWATDKIVYDTYKAAILDAGQNVVATVKIEWEED